MLTRGAVRALSARTGLRWITVVAVAAAHGAVGVGRRRAPRVDRMNTRPAPERNLS